MNFHLKQIAIAGLLTCLGASAFATNYFFVTPKSGEMSKVAPFNVTLGAYTLPGATVGLAYNGTGYSLAPLVSVSGDSALNQSLVTFALTSGNLPAGLVLSAAGIISGTPTAVGGGVIQVTASYKNASGAQAYAVVSVNLVVALAAATLPSGTVGLAYNNGLGFDFATVLSAPADGNFNASLATFAVTSGSLPAGLTLSAAGKLTGTPTAAVANAPITVTATYKGATGAHSYTSTTVSMGVALSTATLPQATVGTVYNTSGYDFAPQLTVTGDPSYNASLATFALTSGNMPAGMSLSAAGKLTGVPTVTSAGTTLQVAANYKSNTGTQSYNWVSVPAGIVDPYWSDVMFLMHMDGTGSSFIDEKGAVVSVAAGSPTLDTANKVLGSASASIPLSAKLSTPSKTAYNFGTNNFTMEAFIKVAAHKESTTIAGRANAGSGWGPINWYFQLSGAGKIRLSVSNGTAAWRPTGLTTVSTGAWHHIAVVREGTTVSYYIDGILDTSFANVTMSFEASGANGELSVGGDNAINIDELRLTKNVARYTSNFTVPSAAYPNQ